MNGKTTGEPEVTTKFSPKSLCELLLSLGYPGDRVIQAMEVLDGKEWWISHPTRQAGPQNPTRNIASNAHNQNLQLQRIEVRLQDELGGS